MAGALLQRKALSQILRIAPSSSLSRSLSRSQLRIRPLKLSPPSSATRAFSSIPAWRQQAAQAEADNSTNQAPQQQLTKFQELADHGIVSRKVISNIVNDMGIHTMTDVQRLTINECLDGADVIAQAKTGTGKTLAFLMPIVQRILRDPNLESRPNARARADDVRALIISPTRELAEQIAVEAKKIVTGTAVRVQTAVGGSQKSFHLRLMQQHGCHILVGTPGRLKDILSDNYSGVRLDNIQTFVLDEADRLLDIGFAPDIAEIQSFMPRQDERARQTLMFSATVPKEVVSLVRQTLRPDFKFVRTVAPDEAATHERIPQHVTFLRGLENQIPAVVELAKRALTAHANDPGQNLPFKAIVFMNSTAEVALTREILSNMRESGAGPRGSSFARHPLEPCMIVEMHSKLTQQERTRNSQRFREVESGILLSSDVSARGMDFPNVSHVIQVGLPKTSDDYIHRLGRTGRAGKGGEGWLLLHQAERTPFRRMLGRGDFNIKSNESLQTAQMNMSQSSEIPASVANILQMVQSGVRSASTMSKTKAYLAMIGSLNHRGIGDKQSVVDIVNDLATYGWGMESLPPVSSHLVSKLGFGGVTGFNVQRNEGFRGGRYPDRRGSGNSDPFDDPFGDSSGGRSSRGGSSDPFGDRDERGSGGFGGGNGGSRGYGRFNDSRGGESRGYGRFDGSRGGDSRGRGRQNDRGGAFGGMGKAPERFST